MDSAINAGAEVNTTHSFLQQPGPELSQVCEDTLRWFYDHHNSTAGLEIEEQTFEHSRQNAQNNRSLRFRSLTRRRKQQQPAAQDMFQKNDSSDQSAKPKMMHSQSMRPIKRRNPPPL
eukprot:TRINITY_DN1841_c0_g1_i2.p1 TRINITY_DN1841_c0_g1~~TRINITY_DN1841_c0_g1_i2.p1  ORF type:complete len:118 (+),score=18.57 TRINITY_DN1841_c0_g1_i2:66-419(+)